jgi:hypothetical protein
MILIDALLEATPQRGVASKTFRTGDYGVCDGVVCETTLVECVAQTTAALFGYGELGRPTQERLGFLVALSGFSFARRPRLEEPLLVEVRLVTNIGEVFIIGGKVWAGGMDGECIADGEIKIFLKQGNA